MRRIFVAIALHQELQNAIAAWQESHAKFGVRWQRGKNLHVTLVPPWHVEDVESIKRQLRRVKFKPFIINFSSVSFGPNPRQPRLIWAEGKTTEEVLDLRMKILDCLGQRPEHDYFKTHITIARFRPQEFERLPVISLNEKVNWREIVQSFVLMETRRMQEGSDYEVLAELPAS